MGISPLGNITYINQNTQAANAATHRVDITPSNVQEFEDKLKDIQETRVTEEPHKIDKDAQNGGNASHQEKNKDEESAETTEEPTPSHHLLDIKA